MSPLELGLIELPTRPRSEYTMAMRRAALLACDDGRLAEAADLTRAAMTESGYARGILADLTHGILGLPKTYVGRADMIADLDDTPERVGQWRIMFPVPDTIRLMAWGITLGLGLGQMRKRYGVRPGNDYVLSVEEAESGAYKATGKIERPIGAHDTRVLRTWDPKFIRCQWWDESFFLMTADGEIRIDPNDGEWMLYTPFGEVKPWEYGAWRALTLAWILQRDALFDRSRHAEVLAPVRVGKVPQGTTERQRKTYLRQIREMQRMAAFVLPPGLEYSIVESTGRIADIYDMIINWAEKDYAMITGAVTTATGSPGFSKGDVQERFTRSILSSFADSLSTTLHHGGLVPWALENYGSPDAPRAEFDTAPPEDKAKRAETIGKAGDALAKMGDSLRKHGKRITDASVEKFAQSLGFEVEDLPPSDTGAIELDAASVKLVVKGSAACASLGLPAFGDERDEMTLAEIEAQATSGGSMPGSDLGGDLLEDDGTEIPIGPGDAPPTDEHAETLAAKMTKHGIPRCEHGSSNRCRLCGIERVRDFTPGRRPGEHRWTIAWRALRSSTPSHGLNGSATKPLFGSPGGVG